MPVRGNKRWLSLSKLMSKKTTLSLLNTLLVQLLEAGWIISQTEGTLEC